MITIPRHLAFEAADALAVRVRWYYRRALDAPEEYELALRYLCRQLELEYEHCVEHGAFPETRR